MAKKYLAGAILLMALIHPLNAVMAAELIEEFKGSRSTNTAEFEARAPWILDWRVAGEFSGSLAVDVSLMEAGTGIHQGNVLKTKNPGNGVRLFDQSGKFYFRVNSTMADWTLKVEQLTSEEAELYTPKQPGEAR